MFADSRGDLLNVTASVGSLNIESLVLAEFNLNDISKIEKIGVYKYRPFSASSSYKDIISLYDANDVGDYYTDSDISYTEYSGTDDNTKFRVYDKTKSAYYSLGDCFLPFRPRSGINKAVFFGNQEKYIDNIRSGTRPRYYMPSRSDYFKYWTSYKKEGSVEYGISSPTPSPGAPSGKKYYGIDDACPFVVYNTDLNVNRIVIKLQTNVGDTNIGLMRTQRQNIIADPLYDYTNATVPVDWKIQYLNSSNIWTDAISFDINSLRSDSTKIIDKDGYVEIFYGIVPPTAYRSTFKFLGYVSSSAALPNTGLLAGYSYIVGASTTEQGQLYVYTGSTWSIQTLTYGFSLYENDIVTTNGTVLNPSNPDYYTSGDTTIFREFIQIRGIRVVVKAMNAKNSTFDLIEMSPRLVVNLSGYTDAFDITKTIANSDSGTYLPVGSLAASNGNITLFNYEDILTENNEFNSSTKTGSIITSYANQNVKFILYETILNVNGYDKYIPIKTMYADSFPRPYGTNSSISIPLRDLYFRLETTNAPSILAQKSTLTYAVASVLDYIGFSNYVFKNITTKSDPVLDYFFIEPGISVAEILQRLAVATQTAMFFDEYNNFVVMSKEYLLPTAGDISERPVNLTLYGNTKSVSDTITNLPNIENINEDQTKIVNDGEIEYSIRYIQKEISNLKSSMYLNQDRAYVYKPVLLWEAGQSNAVRSINGNAESTSGYSLAAAPLNTTLSASVPYVSSNQIQNNIIDLGDGIYWLSRFQGYLYANGEVIRYDAVEYAIPGIDSLVWVTNNNEYQQYFAKIPFNGRIYPTGRIRIYAEPYYESDGITMKNGAVRVHGRGQFDTEITVHYAGLSNYWSSASNVYGVRMQSEYIFSTKPTEDITVPAVGTETRKELKAIGDLAKSSKRNGIIKNFMANKIFADGYVNTLQTTESGTIQSSALVFRGPLPGDNEGKLSITVDDTGYYPGITSVSFPDHKNLISCLYKDLSGIFSFRNFGTRVRIIGKSDNNSKQILPGSSDYYAITSPSAQDQTTINGGSAGIGILVNPENGSGYYFEIVALSAQNIEKYYKYDENGDESQVIHDIVFYKVYDKAQSGQNINTPAVVKKLWGGLGQVLADSGIFAGQDRLSKDVNSTVYDLSIQYEVLSNNKGLRFYLYINNNLLQVVDDAEATISTDIDIKSSLALFVRGGTQAMFEHVYALDDTVLKDSNSKINANPSIFDADGISKNEFLRKYAMSGMVQSTYLSNIKTDGPNTYKMYFEEFGTIMREADYFKVMYDQAYPAFISKVAKTFTNDRSYIISGFYGGAYEAEFLIFNAADRTIVLDETTGSYLRILGVTFTQDTSQKLMVDDYFNRISNFADPQFSNSDIISPVNALRQFNDIKASRAKYGNQKFMLSSIYIQSLDQANNMMGWLVDKTMRPRKSFKVSIYPMPYLQVGDLVNIDYVLDSGIRYVDANKNFLVTEISYGRSEGSITNNISLVEI